jgi:hypothetical protein
MQTRITTTRAAALIVLLILIHSLVLALTNPLGEAPDEPAHMEYVRFVVVDQRLPVQCAAPCVSDVDGEGHQPPLAYLLAALVSAPFIEQTDWVPQAINPQFLWRGGSDPQALVHGNREDWPWQGTILAWRLMRMVSVLLISATAWLVYVLATRISTPQTGIIAILLLALSPQTAIIGSTVSNDALLAFLSVAVLILVVDTRRVRDLLGVGALLGLALLTKQSAVVLLPVVLIASLRTKTWSHRVAALFLGTLVTLFVAGWWYLRNLQLYGDVFGMQLFQQTYAAAGINWQAADSWRTAFVQLMRSAWGVYGWMTIPLPPLWYGIGSAITLAGFFGAALRLGRAPRIGNWWIWSGLLIAVTLVWLGGFAFTVGTVAWQSRLLIVALPLTAIVLAAGFTSGYGITLTGRQALTVAVVAVTCQLGLWWSVVLPRFHAAMPTAERSAQALSSPRDAIFAAPGSAGGIAMLDLDAPATIAPGNEVDIALRWQVLHRPTQDWQVYLVVRDVYKREYARFLQPLHPTLPTSTWTPGDRLISRHRITIPADLTENFYMIQIGLVDSHSSLRAEKRNAALELTGDSVFLPFNVGQPTLP